MVKSVAFDVNRLYICNARTVAGVIAGWKNRKKLYECPFIWAGESVLFRVL